MADVIHIDKTHRIIVKINVAGPGHAFQIAKYLEVHGMEIETVLSRQGAIFGAIGNEFPFDVVTSHPAISSILNEDATIQNTVS